MAKKNKEVTTASEPVIKKTYTFWVNDVKVVIEATNKEEALEKLSKLKKQANG